MRQILNPASVLSRKTWAAHEGLDYEQEQRNIAAEAQANAAPTPSPSDQFKESLEGEWDSSKHPRGGDSHFPQRFSDGWGPGGATSTSKRGPGNNLPADAAPSRAGILTGVHP